MSQAPAQTVTIRVESVLPLPVIEPTAKRLNVPEGHATIAQRFNVGVTTAQRPISPEGTAEAHPEPVFLSQVTHDNHRASQRRRGVIWMLHKSRRDGSMASMSYVSSYFHCVFGTKERRPLIPPPLRDRLWPFLGGIARQNGMKAFEIGGMPDHVHLLLSLPSTISIAKALQLIKGGSSKWVHDTFPEHRLFGWQVKYGAFAVSVSLLDKTIQYIRSQEQHHRKLTFQEEFVALLKRHRIAYDPRYLWE